MTAIGGNCTAQLQVRQNHRNAIGESVPVWMTAHTLKGFLDLSSGSAKYTSYNTKLQESTHIFLSDYLPLPDITAENSRLCIGGLVYDVMLIDDPMGLHEHLEIYLKFTGGQQNAGAL